MAIGLVLGLAIGLAVAWMVSRRLRAGVDDLNHTLDERAAAVAAEQQRTDAIVQERHVLTAALDALPRAVVLMHPDGTELFRNAAGRAYAEARDGRARVEGAIARARLAAMDGRAIEEEVRLAGPPRQTILVEARLLAEGGALVMASDLTRYVAIDQVRRDFVANLSHELRGPVGAVGVLAEAVADEDDPVVRARLIGQIDQESRRMASTVDDLLELSRLEFEGAGQTEMVVVADLVSAAVAATANQAELAGVEVSVDPGELDLKAAVNQTQVLLAMGNLVENAVKYSDDGGRVEVSVRAEARWVCVEVRDDGIGIAASELDRIFERFYRVDQARSRATGGTGLGLSIVRHVAENHGGTVSVASHEGRGSTFTLRLPRGEPAS